MNDMPSQKRILLSPPHMSDDSKHFIDEAFESNWIAPLGPNVDSFEREMASYVGVKEAVAVSSGTAAIHLALCLLGVGKDDLVFCSSLTFVATANPILYQGAEPAFIDSEPDTWNMSPQALERAFEDAKMNRRFPKAVIIVNLYGQSAKMDELLAICQKYGVPVIEDSAESLGSYYKGKASGTFGDFGIYSFNGNKIITTSGGGMLLSNNETEINRARFLATQARDPAPFYQHSEIGFNYRMSNILAGLGRSQLKVLEERVTQRREVFKKYTEGLSDLPGVQFMPELEDTFSNRWLTALTIETIPQRIKMVELLKKFEQNNIEVRSIWKPMHLQPLFKKYAYYKHNQVEDISEKLFQTGICLPSGSSLTEAEQQRVIECLRASLTDP